MKTTLARLMGITAIAAVTLTGCSQKTDTSSGGSSSTSSESSTTSAAGDSSAAATTDAAAVGSSTDASAGSSASKAPQAPGTNCERTVQNDFKLPTAKPTGFKSGFKVALVRQSGVGDYFEQWGSGATAQIKAAGGQVTSYDARGDNGKQVTMFDQAINSKPDVIIVDHGLADSVNPKIDQAIAAGIPVVVYDAAIANCKAMYISQNDESIAKKILDDMKKENPDGGKIAYVNVSGIAPLDSRAKVYEQFLKDNPTFTQVAKFGKYTESVASDTATEGAVALQAAPTTSLVFCAYDELCKGSMIALRQDNMTGKVKVYGVDVSTADIQLMIPKDSPWRATAATDPANVGAIVARAAVAAAAGIDMPEKMTIPATLITQDLLRSKNVQNMSDLRKALPELSTPNILGASWVPEIKPGQ